MSLQSKKSSMETDLYDAVLTGIFLSGGDIIHMKKYAT